ESDLEREVDVRWISKRVGNKQPLRLRSIIFSLGRCRQKKPIEHDGQPDAVSESYPEPKGRSNQEVRRGNLCGGGLRVSDERAENESKWAEYQNARQPHSK